MPSIQRHRKTYTSGKYRKSLNSEYLQHLTEIESKVNQPAIQRLIQNETKTGHRSQKKRVAELERVRKELEE